MALYTAYLRTRDWRLPVGLILPDKFNEPFDPGICHGIAVVRKASQKILDDKAVVLAIDAGSA